jgi:signal transduction histidine kinase/DNA-binding response OmpR family regulator
MKNYLLYLFFLLSLISFGQNQAKIDSLKTLLSTSKTNKQKATLNLYLSEIYTTADKKRSIEYALKSTNYVFKTTNHELLGNIYIQLAKLYYNQKKDNLAIMYLTKIDSLYTLDNVFNKASFMAKIYRSEISKFTFTMEGVMQAKKYILEALNLAKKHNNIEFINEAKYHLAQWHGFLSQEVAPKENLDTARFYIHEIMPYFKSKNNYNFLSKAYNTLASIEMALNNYKAAEHYYNEQLQSIKKTNDTISIGESYYSYGILFRRLKQPNKGIVYLDSALTIFNKIGFRTDKRKKDLYKDYAYLYEQKGDYKNAFNNIYKALLLKDTIYDNENTKQAMELEKKYQTQKKEHQIVLLQTENELAKQQKINQRNLFITGISITSFAGLFFFFLYKNRQKTTRKLLELDQLKSNLFANISHEFRTPLTLISSPIQQQLKKKSISNKDKTSFENIQRNTNRLLDLVNQLLDISKIEAGSLKLKVALYNLPSFYGKLLDGFSFIANQKEIDFKVKINSITDKTWFDKDVLEKISTNLLSNAIKYTPTKGTIITEVFVKENTLNFIVKNTGEGIASNQISKIFNRFYQLDSHSEGTGIGLALVKELVLLHKGKITVESTPKQWTIFTVLIPVYKKAFKSSEIILEPQTIEKSEISNLKIDNSSEFQNPVINEETENPIALIVEDNKDLNNYIATLLEEEYTIIQAENGAQGISQALKYVPDIIISDIRMPVKDGIELCNALKTDERTNHIPIILLTAKAGEENQITGIKAGADVYITKPFNDDFLLLNIKQLIAIRKKLQKRYSQEVILKPADIAISSIEESFLNQVQLILDSKLIESSFHIDEFCKAVGMSRMQLHRKLKALTGLSTSEFIKSQRLKLAAQLLKTSDINIAQVGYSVGFNDHAYFSKCFKEMYKCSPSEYTKK